MIELKRKKEAAIRDAAAKLLRFEPGKLIDWNGIVTAKRLKLKQLERIEKERMKREKVNPQYDNLREFMYKTICD